MIRITRQGKHVLVLLLLLYIASLTSQSGLLILPIGLILGCYVVNGIIARLHVAGLKVSPPANIHVAENQKLDQPWTVLNERKKPAQLITVECSLGVVLRIPYVQGLSTATWLPEKLNLRRGVHRWDNSQIGSTAPFGLVQARKLNTAPGEIVVYPAIYETSAPRTAGMDPVVGGKHAGNRSIQSGGEFAGVRPFQPGDPLKHIHWKASSKGQGLMMKTFQEELAGRIGFILDCGHSGNDEALDDCLRAAGSLMFAALDDGHHIEWVDLEGGCAELFPPFSDGQEILDRLAKVIADPGCLNLERITRAAELVSKRAAICVVLASMPEVVVQWIGELHAQRRTLSIYLHESIKIDPQAVIPTGIPIFRYSSRDMVPEG